MRVLLAHHLPLAGSPSGRSTRDLAVGLVAQGHDVQCLVIERRAEESSADGLSVERVLCRDGDERADLPFDIPGFTPHAWSTLVFDAMSDAQIEAYRDALRKRLDLCVDQFDPHIIHCQHVWLLGHLALESGVPYVMTAQGPELRAYDGEPRYQRLVDQAVENTGRIICSSRHLAEQTAVTLPEAQPLIESIHAPVDLRLYQPGLPSRASMRATLRLPDDGRPVIVMAGELAAGEGGDVFLNAVSALQSRPQKATIVICGDGPERGLLEAQARHMHLNGVRFLGELPRRERALLLQLADVVAIPSSTGEVVQTAIEAMAALTPVVAADCGPMAEVVRDDVGALVDPNDHELLAEMLARAIDGGWKFQKGPAARRRAEREFSLEKCVERHVKLYESVLIQRFGSLDHV
jgi:glycosyltransferase involved in cell wall biosynthesis